MSSFPSLSRELCPPDFAEVSSNSLPSVTGEADWRSEGNAFLWTIETIDNESPTGSLEFRCEGDADAFFPVKVGFVAAGSVADVDVSESSLGDWSA